MRVFFRAAGLNVKWKNLEREQRAVERPGCNWTRAGGCGGAGGWGLLGDFDAIGMSSQACEHRPNRT